MTHAPINGVILSETKDPVKARIRSPGTDPLPLDQFDRLAEDHCNHNNHNLPAQGLGDESKKFSLEVPIFPKPGDGILNRPLGSTPRIIQLSLSF